MLNQEKFKRLATKVLHCIENDDITCYEAILIFMTCVDATKKYVEAEREKLEGQRLFRIAG